MVAKETQLDNYPLIKQHWERSGSTQETLGKQCVAGRGGKQAGRKERGGSQMIERNGNNSFIWLHHHILQAGITQHQKGTPHYKEFPSLGKRSGVRDLLQFHPNQRPDHLRAIEMAKQEQGRL